MGFIFVWLYFHFFLKILKGNNLTQDSNQEWTVGKVQKWGVDFLKSKNIEDAKISIDLLLCFVLNLERIELYLKFDLPLNIFELNQVKEYIKRLVNNEPLQYILGKTTFFNLEFKVDKSVLIPRPETEELVNIIIKDNTDNKELTILDIGTGSGCIAISLAKYLPQSKVFAIDISENAINIAKHNARINKIDNIEIHKLDILTKIPKTKFDIIVSNPPYISTQEFENLDKNVRDFEPEVALTDFGDGLTFYRRFYEIFIDILAPKGVFYLENSFEQGDKLVSAFNKKYKIEAIEDSAKIKRFLRGEMR